MMLSFLGLLSLRLLMPVDQCKVFHFPEHYKLSPANGSHVELL
jgi:hypothetical protein